MMVWLFQETPKKPPRRKPPSTGTKSTTVSASPPRMVFINKRSSTGSHDSASEGDRSTAERNKNTKEPNGNSENNNTMTRQARHVCDNSSNDNGKQRDAEIHCADVANSNHQEALVITSNAEILCQKRRTTLDNNNLTAADGNNETQTVDNQDYLEHPTDGSIVQYRSKGESYWWESDI